MHSLDCSQDAVCLDQIDRHPPVARVGVQPPEHMAIVISEEECACDDVYCFLWLREKTLLRREKRDFVVF